MTLSYNKLAKIYDKLYGDEQDKKYSFILKHFSFKGTLLDAGCGTGNFIKKLIKNSNNIDFFVCLDNSRGMLEIAKKKIKKYSIGDIILADIKKLPIRTYVFDTIVLFTVIHEVPESLHCILELAKMKSIVIITLLKKKKEILKHIINRGVRKTGIRSIKIINKNDVKDLFIILKYK
ncbi:MAG: class I SAM-dependent methyltransferase [Thermoproteales archaeon]|nr:class I SAM-dependent methyltransferase [Thermoproteales archaeon]